MTQQEEDDKLIPNVGDQREMVQRGSITANNVVTPVDITFIRKRNASGGVDVIAKMPSVNLSGQSKL